MSRDTTKDINNKLNEIALIQVGQEKDMIHMKKDMTDIKGTVENLDKKISTYYVNHDQFWPVKMLVYGLVSGVLLTVLGAIVGIVVVQPKITHNPVSIERLEVK